MSYTIAVQAGLAEIRRQLEEEGYHIVNLEQYRGPVSAVVYADVNELGDLPIVDALDGVMNVGAQGLQGVVFIDASGRSGDEVVSLVGDQLG